MGPVCGFRPLATSNRPRPPPRAPRPRAGTTLSHLSSMSPSAATARSSAAKQNLSDLILQRLVAGGIDLDRGRQQFHALAGTLGTGHALEQRTHSDTVTHSQVGSERAAQQRSAVNAVLGTETNC